MLYVAPKGSNDDWYWLYSTVYEGRRTPAYVVSNDYMRDHRATFAESRAFLRWRSSQIVYFSFSKAVEPLQLGNASYALPTVSLYRPGTPLPFISRFPAFKNRFMTCFCCSSAHQVSFPGRSSARETATSGTSPPWTVASGCAWTWRRPCAACTRKTPALRWRG
jgi:hypothetical protein